MLLVDMQSAMLIDMMLIYGVCDLNPNFCGLGSHLKGRRFVQPCLDPMQPLFAAEPLSLPVFG